MQKAMASILPRRGSCACAGRRQLTQTSMMANVFQGAGKPSRWECVPVPRVQAPTDVVIRVRKTTICGTDLHILGGNVPECQPGTNLGHEGIGEVVEVGSDVKNFSVGDRLLTSCITACGNCPACTLGQFAFCTSGGWQLGNTIHGMQAEYALIPHADFTGHKLPESVPVDSPEEDPYIMASDILPTAYEIGLRSGDIPDDCSVAIVGAGPVGLAGVLSATAMKPAQLIAIDVNENRLRVAESMGATDAVNNSAGDAVEQVMEMTGGKGVDYVVECIGTPLGWGICQDIVAMGGQVSILGVHGKEGRFDLQKLWQHNVSIHTGMVHCNSIQFFLDKIEAGEIKADQLISHHFAMSRMEEAYEFFRDAGNTGSLKVVLTNDL